jgi:hypothetical protein
VKDLLLLDAKQKKQTLTQRNKVGRKPGSEDLFE